MDTSDAAFEQDVIEKSKKIPVLVDFWASWCPPCEMLGPILEKVAKDSDGKFVLAKLDVQENQKTASKYKVMSLPNVKLFRDEKVVDEFVGARSEGQVIEFLDKNL